MCCISFWCIKLFNDHSLWRKWEQQQALGAIQQFQFVQVTKDIATNGDEDAIAIDENLNNTCPIGGTSSQSG